jgi:hypothetical protein
VASIGSHPTSGKVIRPSWPNQRATVRYRCPPATAGRVYLAEDLEFQRAWLQDLSATGIGLLMTKPLEHGLSVAIQLVSPNSSKNYSLSAHVVHSTQESGGDWIIGFQFAKPLTPDEVDDLL